MSNNDFEPSGEHSPKSEAAEGRQSPIKTARRKNQARRSPVKSRTESSQQTTATRDESSVNEDANLESASAGQTPSEDSKRKRPGRSRPKRSPKKTQSLESDPDPEPQADFSEDAGAKPQVSNSETEREETISRNEEFEPSTEPGDEPEQNRPYEMDSGYSGHSGGGRRRSRYRGSGSQTASHHQGPGRHEDSSENSDRSTGFGKVRFKVRQIIQQLQSTLKELNEVLNLLNQAEKERSATDDEISSLRKELNQVLPKHDISARKRFPPKPHRRHGRPANVNPGSGPRSFNNSGSPPSDEIERDRTQNYSET